MILQFYWSEVQHRSQGAGIKVLAGVYSFQEAPGAPRSAASIPWLRETPLLHPESQHGGAISDPCPIVMSLSDLSWENAFKESCD